MIELNKVDDATVLADLAALAAKGGHRAMVAERLQHLYERKIISAGVYRETGQVIYYRPDSGHIQ
jgi:hypothetical protein